MGKGRKRERPQVARQRSKGPNHWTQDLEDMLRRLNELANSE